MAARLNSGLELFYAESDRTRKLRPNQHTLKTKRK